MEIEVPFWISEDYSISAALLKSHFEQLMFNAQRSHTHTHTSHLIRFSLFVVNFSLYFNPTLACSSWAIFGQGPKGNVALLIRACRTCGMYCTPPLWPKQAMSTHSQVLVNSVAELYSQWCQSTRTSALSLCKLSKW